MSGPEMPAYRLVVCIVIKHRYCFFANDFSAIESALGLVSELFIPP